MYTLLTYLVFRASQTAVNITLLHSIYQYNYKNLII
jgi:hypothetical protein